jgi:hypothetical protein
MSFLHLLGLDLDDTVPNAKTIWLLKDTLTKAGIMEQLFSQFNWILEDCRLFIPKGTIVDAAFVDAPASGTITVKIGKSKRAHKM